MQAGPPGDIARLYNAAVAAFQSGALDEAERSLRLVLSVLPNHAPSHQIFGLILHQRGRHQDAIAAMTRSVQIAPNAPEFWRNMAPPFSALGRQPEAIAACRRSVRVEPKFADGWFALSQLCIEAMLWHEAASALQRVIELTPDNLAARSDFAWLMERGNRPDEAIEQYDFILAADPNNAAVHLNRGNALHQNARTSEALESLRRAVDAARISAPDDSQYLSALLLTMHYDARYSAADLLTAHCEWERRFGHPLRDSRPTHDNDRSQNRRLRIGFVSPDFRNHVVGWNIAPILRHRDTAAIETICYSTSLQNDSFTDKLRGMADQWRDISKLSDVQAAEQIRADRVDLLVDLSLHSNLNRITLFARKPAPVQLTYLGYCSTTGLSAIDARLTDQQLDPPDTDLSVYSERTIRLPRSYWCYEPGGQAPEVNASPFEQNGCITFGCLNSSAKLSTQVLENWTAILSRLPDAHLKLMASPGSQTESIKQLFAARGVDPSRIDFVGKQPIEQYLASYLQIDIALDVFPFSGGITSCDAVWMGVPVITLRGNTAVGRGGASVMGAIGLPQMIASTQSQYIETAIQLANDRERLRELRSTLRARVQSSPLRDAGQFTKDFESACRACWINWCSDESRDSGDR